MLRPTDCTLFMQAFCDAGMMDDLELFECLQSHLLNQIEQTEGPNLAQMFISHSKWANHLLQPKKKKAAKSESKGVAKLFRKYNEAFIERIEVNLVSRVDEINLQAAMLVMSHGKIAILKRRDNMRLMFSFSIRAVSLLAREKAALGNEFEQMCVQYLHLAHKYCLHKNDITELANEF